MPPKEPSNTHTCAFVYLIRALISPKHRYTYTYTNSQARTTFPCVYSGQGCATMHSTLVSDSSSKVRRFVLQSREQQIHVCYGHWQLLTGFGTFLKSTSVCNQDLNQQPSRLSCCHQNQGPSEENISTPPPFGMWLDQHRRAKTRWKWLLR